MSLTATEALIGTLPPEKIRGFQKGTVTADFEPTTDLRVTMDGDTDPSHVMSNVGELQKGQRVMVVFTEPHGAYVAWLLHPPAWRVLPLHAGWHDLGTVVGVVYETAAIRRVGDDVEVRGMVKRTSGADTVIADFPTGFVPAKGQGFASECAGVYASLYALPSLGFFFNGSAADPVNGLSIACFRYSITP